MGEQADKPEESFTTEYSHPIFLIIQFLSYYCAYWQATTGAPHIQKPSQNDSGPWGTSYWWFWWWSCSGCGDGKSIKMRLRLHIDCFVRFKREFRAQDQMIPRVWKDQFSTGLFPMDNRFILLLLEMSRWIAVFITSELVLSCALLVWTGRITSKVFKGLAADYQHWLGVEPKRSYEAERS